MEGDKPKPDDYRIGSAGSNSAEGKLSLSGYLG